MQVTRMQVLETPVALPGCCFICGAADREFFVDTNRSLEFHGAVYFCSDCLGEMANLVNYSTPDQMQKMKQQIDFLERRVYELTAANEGLEEAVHGLRRVRGFGTLVSAGSGPVPILVTSPEQPASEGDGDVAEGESSSPGQVYDEGVANVPSSSDESEFSLRLD